MVSSPNDKALPPTYDESQALADSADVHQPTNVDETEHEEDLRPLPAGWIRQWDSSTENYFYVDTTANPPVSVWEHPADLPEEHESAPVASSSRPIDIQKEKVDVRVPWEDEPRTPTPYQHTSLPMQKEKVDARVAWEDEPRATTPYQYTSLLMQKEKVDARVPWEDLPPTATSDQHTSLSDHQDFIFPARRRKSHGPIGLLIRLIFDHCAKSKSRHPSTSRVYAPPTYPMSRCAQRRSEWRARKMERREQIRAWSAAQWGSERPRDGSGLKKRGCCSRSCY